MTPEGVDRLSVEDPSGRVVIASASVYWLYPDCAGCVVGSAAIGYPLPIVEIAFDGFGGQVERRLEWCPDLMHATVKFGHWWIGTSAPVHG